MRSPEAVFAAEVGYQNGAFNHQHASVQLLHTPSLFPTPDLGTFRVSFIQLVVLEGSHFARGSKDAVERVARVHIRQGISSLEPTFPSREGV